MIKTITGLSLAFVCSVALAQDKPVEMSKSVICDSTQKVLTTLMQNYNETPIWTGVDAEKDSKYVLLSNLKTKSWTFVQYNADVACILGVGGASNLVDFNKNII